MNRTVLHVLVAAVVTGACTVAVSASVATGERRAPAVTSVTGDRYWRVGPAVQKDGDANGVRVVEPLALTVPAGGTWSGPVTVSVAYRTSGRASFFLALFARDAGGRFRTVLPQYRRLAGTGAYAATTQTYLVTGVPGGTTLRLEPRVTIGGSQDGRADTVKVVLHALLHD